MPPPRSKTIPMQMHKAGHPNGNGFSVYRSEKYTEDYNKLMHVMKYLRETQELTLTIELGDHPNWWVDSSYAVHPDMCIHSGIYMTLGEGATYSGSCKQKRIPEAPRKQILWAHHFLVVRGENLPTTTITKVKKHNLFGGEWIILKQQANTSPDIRYFLLLTK